LAINRGDSDELRFFNVSIFSPKRQKQMIAHTHDLPEPVLPVNHFLENARTPSPKQQLYITIFPN
jgi:hypothetical protein